jgi:hypothetical protein
MLSWECEGKMEIMELREASDRDMVEITPRQYFDSGSTGRPSEGTNQPCDTPRSG